MHTCARVYLLHVMCVPTHIYAYLCIPGQAATLNLGMAERFKEKNIFLVALAKAKVYKVHGMCRVINGVDLNGVQHDEPNVGADMQELARGRWAEIPDDVAGDSRWIRVVGYTNIFSADYLGAQAMLPMVESPSAHVFCRGCDYDSRSDMAGRPFSFLRGGQASGQPAAFQERDWSTLKAELERLRAGVSVTELKKTYHDLGLNKLYFALDPEYIPDIIPTTIAPQDVLHLFPDGLLRSELAWLMYIFAKLGLDFKKLDWRIRQYKGLPKDVRIPSFPDKLKKGVAGGRPESKSTVRMTGSQCMHFSLHRCATPRPVPASMCTPTPCALFSMVCSFQILNPLLTDEMRSNPAWLSWLKLVEIFTLVIQHELHVDDIETIDDLVLEHSKLFDNVPEYNGLKRPKHHFLSHLALDIWRFGPPRGYWCFGFEAFNRVIKRGAQRSNWKNTTVSVLKYWSARSARSLSHL